MLAKIVEVNAGRIRFSPTDASPPFSTWSSLLTTGVRSIRIVVLECNDLQSTDQEPEIADRIKLRDILPFEVNVAGTKPVVPTFRVRCRRYTTCVCTNVTSMSLSNAITTKFADELGWILAKSPDIEIHILLDGSRLTVEIPILVRPLVEELPKPGFKRVESFIMAKAAQIRPGDTVLDPMCGRAAFLVEAATFWPDATYEGVDCSEGQLIDAKVNIEMARVNVQIRTGDARRLENITSCSIDKIICCPPFGRQFGSLEEIPLLYRQLLQEWSRILKDSGTMVLLIDTGNIDTMLGAIDNAGCHVSFMRKHFRLGKIQATIMLVRKGQTTAPCHSGRFFWEVGAQKDRALWAVLRSKALPSLVQFSTNYVIQNLMKAQHLQGH